ncbi:hypothetical protein QZH41_007960 [Actinostola sp. cb2023]|nr:hypothetical protein QZH41_007960 [Actinostola sp. cb2023]
MFLQVVLDEEDQDLHRYLWRDFDVNAPIKEFRMLRLTFGINSSPFLAISVTRELATEHQKKYPVASKEIQTNMYVDDYLGGAQDSKSAVELYSELKDLMNEGGFDLTKWSSNSIEVLEVIPAEDRASMKTEDTANEPELLKALGITWNPKKDVFQFILTKKIDLKEVKTKRTLLGAISKVFDPLGLVSPFIITAKLIMQDLWVKGIPWDEKLDEGTLRRWTEWYTQLETLATMEIPRSFLPKVGEIVEVQVHGFADASEKAYAGVVYVRLETDDEQVKTCMVMSKSKLAPLKRLTLPRLELMAALITARLARYVIKALNLQANSVYLWTDSMIVLQWICGYPNDWKPFVCNRVQEIQQLFEPECWRHCSSVDNAADQASRGSSLSDLQEKWWTGPSWLTGHQSKWPKTLKQMTQDDDLLEKKKNKEESLTSNVAQTKAQEPLTDTTKFEKWSKIVAVTARVMKCYSIWKQKALNKDTDFKNNIENGVTSEEIKQAEVHWMRKIQEECYSDEINCLRQHQRVHPKSSLLCLDPFFDDHDNLLKVGGRLRNAELQEEQRQQVILPSHHDLVGKIIKSYHEKLLHAGVEHVLSCTRQRLWIIHGRREVKKVSAKCEVCKRWSAPRACQKAGQLPRERVVPEPCFTNVGMDFAGPFYLKEFQATTKTAKASKAKASKKDNLKKAYVCLFSCMSSRAVHLELVMSMDTDRVLMALRRLFARRGLCQIIWSDNFRSFKAANRQLQAL